MVIVLAAIDVINNEADFVYGIGGAPEGALRAALALSAGDNMKAKLIPYQTIWPNDVNTQQRVTIEKKLFLNIIYIFKNIILSKF